MPTSARQIAPRFTKIFGEFAASQRADVGIGPYYTVRIHTACKYGEAYPVPLFSPHQLNQSTPQNRTGGTNYEFSR